MSDTELELGAQTRAAQAVAAGIPDVMKVVEELGTSLEGAMSGFKGGAAAGLVEAVSAWFDAAQQVGPALATYAENLVATDTAAARNDDEQQQLFASYASRLGGR